MAYLNADIPPIYCKIRKEYLYDLEKHQGESVDCCIFSVVSITDRSLLFNIMLPNGACFWRLPISAFFQEKFDRSKVVDMPIDQLQIWNSFSYYPSVHCFSFLRGKRGKYFGKDKKNYSFEYLFTIDWGHPDSNILDTEHSEIPAEHKCAHILALDSGNYAAQPNNRILWDAPNYTTDREVPDYMVQTTKWNVENKDWLTEDSKKMFYETEEKK